MNSIFVGLSTKPRNFENYLPTISLLCKLLITRYLISDLLFMQTQYTANVVRTGHVAFKVRVN